MARRQAMRSWYRAMRAIEHLRDPESVAALAALRAAAKDDPDPKTAALNLGFAAMEAARACKVTWAAAMMDLLRRFEERSRDGGEDASAPGPA